MVIARSAPISLAASIAVIRALDPHKRAVEIAYAFAHERPVQVKDLFADRTPRPPR